MRVIFLGKHTGGTNNCLGIDAETYLNQYCDIVQCVVDSQDKLYNYCKKKGINVTEDITQCYNFNNIDLIISYGWGQKITQKLIDKPRIGCINFHPAPLPDWRGMGGVFNYALYEKLTDWGCSAHFVDATFDTGDIIKTNRFSIQDIDTIPSLTKLSHIHMLTLLKEVINIIMKNKTTPELIPRVKQGKGRYISKKDLDLLREIKLDDSIQEIDNKIKSCFCPPHHGAYITIKDKQYSIINSEMLNKININ